MTSKFVICGQIRSADDKIIYAKRKKYFQDRFRTEIDVTVGVISQGIIYYKYIKF